MCLRLHVKVGSLVFHFTPKPKNKDDELHNANNWRPSALSASLISLEMLLGHINEGYQLKTTMKKGVELTLLRWLHSFFAAQKNNLI